MNEYLTLSTQQLIQVALDHGIADQIDDLPWIDDGGDVMADSESQLRDWILDAICETEKPISSCPKCGLGYDAGFGSNGCERCGFGEGLID